MKRPRTNRLEVRLTEEERDLIEHAAEVQATSASAIVRWCVRLILYGQHPDTRGQELIDLLRRSSDARGE